MIGKESGHPRIEEDDKRWLHPALQHDVHLNILSNNHEMYLGDDRTERKKVGMKGGGQTSGSLEKIGSGKEDFRMETEFEAYKGDFLDGSDWV